MITAARCFKLFRFIFFKCGFSPNAIPNRAKGYLVRLFKTLKFLIVLDSSFPLMKFLKDYKKERLRPERSASGYKMQKDLFYISIFEWCRN